MARPLFAPGAPLGVLRRRNFALYWSGQAVSLTGTWMQVLAQSWVVVGFTSSAMALGWLNVANTLPMMALTLFGGVLADRFDKRRILIVTQVALMALAFAMAALYGFHLLRLWHIYALALCNGVASAYDMPANQALTPELVERDEIPHAIALNQASFHGSRIIGPALAGVLIAAMGVTSAFIANGLSFFAVIGSLLLIHPRPITRRAPQGSPLLAMREGFQYVRERTRLLVLMAFSVLMAFFIFPNFMVMMPHYAKEVLRVDTKGYGALMASSGVGALLGSLLLLGVRKERRVLRISLGMGGIVVAMAILAGSRFLLLSCVAIFVNSVCFSSIGGLSATIVQEAVPDHLRGRVMSLNTLTFAGVMPFAALLLSWLTDHFGMRRELLGSTLMFGLAAAFLVHLFIRSPEVEAYRHEEAATHGASGSHPSNPNAAEPVPAERG